MKRLHNDISRCVGRSDLTPDSVTCPDRERCARYLTMALDRECETARAQRYSIITNLRDPDGVCRRRIEVGE